MKFASLKVFAAASLLATFAASVSAGTATGTMAVSATVQPKCTIDSIGAMAFGVYVQESGNIDQSATINLNCPIGTNYTIGIDGFSGAVRNMTYSNLGVTSNLQYNLFSDPARTSIWGAIGGAVGSVVAGAGTGAIDSIPVYGRITDAGANQTVPPGVYNAVVTVTVNY